MRNPPNIMASDRAVARLTSGLFVLLLFGCAFQLVISLTLGVAQLLRLPVAVTVVAIILSIAGLVLLSIRFWAYASHAIERQSATRRCIRAEAEAGGRLAAERPVPDANALTLPAVIYLRPRWQANLLMALAYALVLALLAGMSAALHNTLGAWVPYYLAAGMALIMFFAFFVGGMALNKHILIVDDDGISYRHDDWTRTVPWADARLFALLGRTRNCEVYELSLPLKAVRFKRLLQPPTRFTPSEPDEPFADYDQRMRALLSLIAGRTNLPLHDLRP